MSSNPAIAAQALDNVGLTGGRLASTEHLKTLPLPPLVQHYGVTKEGCTAYYKTASADSLVGGYNDANKRCDQTNPWAGRWVVLPRALTKSDIDAMHAKGMSLVGPVKEQTPTPVVLQNDETPMDKIWLGVGLIVAMIAAVVAWHRWPNQPTYALLILIAFAVLAFAIYPSVMTM